MRSFSVELAGSFHTFKLLGADGAEITNMMAAAGFAESEFSTDWNSVFNGDESIDRDDYLASLRIVLFAAEVATGEGYHVLVDESEDTLYERFDALIDSLPDDTDCYDSAFGTVECNDIEDAIDRIRLGQWSYSQRV